jgi:hypothetical protein
MEARLAFFNVGFMMYVIFLKNETSVNLLVENKRNVKIKLPLRHKSA